MRLYIFVLLLAAVAVFFLLTPASAVVYVSRSNSGPVYDGNSWETAYNSIQQGLDDAAFAGEEVWVAQGLYVGSITLRSGVVLKGGYSGVGAIRDIKAHPTTLHAEWWAIVVGADNATIDGFVIDGGAPAIDCVYTSPTISNNSIRNTAGWASINCVYSNAIIANNQIYNSSLNGILLDHSNPKIINNVISGDDTSGIHCWDTSSPVIANNTIVGNGSYGVICMRTSSPLIVNNIIAFNCAGIWGDVSAGCFPVIRRNCVYGNGWGNYEGGIAPGVGDIYADPRLASTDFGDFHLQPDSPCINKGELLAHMWPTDMDGQPRVEGSAVDMGADESYGETYNITPRVIYVDGNAQGGNDGSSWVNAYRGISAALSTVEIGRGAEIWVASGIYDQVRLRSFAHLYGGFKGTEESKTQRDFRRNTTIIQARDNTQYAVTGANMATVDGFTIRNGKHGVRCSGDAPRISNNIITGAEDSGIWSGVWGPTATNNIIINNGKYGVYLFHGYAYITNNTIVNNGTGLYCFDNQRLYNNIVAYNTRGIEGGGGVVSSHNNVFGNSLGDYLGVNPGYWDISEDPLFFDTVNGDFHIRPDSPCRNAGSNSAPALPHIDMDGQLRIEGGKVDIGADESHGEGTVPNIHYVKADSPYNGPGNDWEHAWHTVADGLAAARWNDEVRVAQGYYNEKITLRNGVRLRGGYLGIGSHRNVFDYPTTINAGNTAAGNYAVTGADGGAVDGFMITGGHTGVYCNKTAPLITGCIITANGTYGVGCYDSSATLVNNLIKLNGGGVYCSNGTPTILNNTIVDNTGRGVDVAKGSPTLINNILAHNGIGVLGNPVLFHNNVYGNAIDYFPVSNPHPSDISADPLFADRPAGDYSLLPTSPCIDAGISSSPLLPLLDINGDGRICAGFVDIGADEWWPDAKGIADAKNATDGSSVRCDGGIVSAVWPDFFYMQSPNRINGLRVNKAGHGVSVGMKIGVQGVVQTTADGERCINAAVAYQFPPPDNTGSVDPLAANLQALGGNGVWSLQEVTGESDGYWRQSTGVNTIGLLMRVWGKVTQIDVNGSFFYIDDGSGIQDGTQTEVATGAFEDSVGVRVNYDPLGISKGDYVVITGIGSCLKVGDNPVRLILPRSGEVHRML